MKKCKSCGTPSKNKPYEGDPNPYNLEHCWQCAIILQQVDMLEEVFSRPNIQGNRRIVKLTAVITKP